jgi:hypothetical protein
MKKVFFILSLFTLIYSCTKKESNPTVSPPVLIKLGGCDSIKQGLLKTTSDTVRLVSCVSITDCDSIRLGLLKTTADTIRLLSCIKISGLDSSRLGILKIFTVNDLPADTLTGLNSDGTPNSAGTISYYSLENNKQILAAEAFSVNWDIAFSGNKILINGGSSGPGLGGAFVLKGTLFDDVKKIPNDSTFEIDNANSYAIPTGSNMGWYIYDILLNLYTPINRRILIIRTAAGKYAKIEIISFYKGGKTLSASASATDKLTKQRYYTFRYVYQPNGTKLF